MAKEECGNCKFYKDEWDGKLKSGYGKCLRLPEKKHTNDGKWCGEYVRLTGFNQNEDWEESVGLKTTVPMRDRLREIATTDNSDDYDRAVLLLLEDFARLKVLLAVQTDANQRT